MESSRILSRTTGGKSDESHRIYIRAKIRGCGNWEDYLTLRETRRLIELADIGYGLWATDPAKVDSMRKQVAHIDSKTAWSVLAKEVPNGSR